MIQQTACLLILLIRFLSAAEEQWAVSSHGLDVPFRSWEAEGAGAGGGVLVQEPAAAAAATNQPP
ncbi:MAG: hypothetical protein Q8Q59_05505 [Luteolibacter sp.]|jgi:hypothetical protein|nr:hypothetical protein [Luteolibacter sp.]